MKPARFVLLTSICGVLFAASCKTSPSDLAKQFVVRRVTTSGSCQVWDSKASPIGTVIVGGGPFNTQAEATTRMCELRTEDVTDASKCFNVNPKDACGDDAGNQTQLDLPDDVVRYLDTIPSVKVNIDDAILPNKRKLGEYREELLRRGKDKEGATLIFPTDTTEDQLSQLFVKFFTVANDLVDDTKHTYPQGADVTEPKQTGLGYNLGSRDYATRAKMNLASCKLKVFALDCSGLLFQVFKQSGCKGMNLTALDQSKPANLNAAITGVVNGVEAKSKGKLGSADILTGDIIYWDKLAGGAASHIGIVLKSGATLFVFQSNGSGGGCEDNLIPARGPRTFALTDTYWFSGTSNWTVLRYEVQ